MSTGLDRRARTVLGRSLERTMPMTDVTIDVLKTQLRQLRLPTMGREFEKRREMPPRPTRLFQFLLA